MRYIILIFSLLIFSCKKKTDQDDRSNRSSISILENQLDSLFNLEIGHDEPGAALLVSYDGVPMIAKGYGLRNLETKEPITPSTNMEMASVSKQFTALSILSLLDEEKLSLSDEVFKYFPYETFRGVTIEQLINHTSGIEDAENAFSREHTQWVARKDR